MHKYLVELYLNDENGNPKGRDGFQSRDGVHPNEEYQRRFLAPMIKHFLHGVL